MQPGLLLRVSLTLGAVVDGLMLIPLLSPSVGSAMLGVELKPTTEFRYASMLTASLMFGWTLLLLWALADPIGRRGVAILTAVVVLCLGLSGAFAVTSGLVPFANMLPTFVMQTVLLLLFVVGYCTCDKKKVL